MSKSGLESWKQADEYFYEDALPKGPYMGRLTTAPDPSRLLEDDLPFKRTKDR